MQGSKGNLFTRPDTFFGVCQGLGEDLGFPPNLLRIGLALLLFVNPTAVVLGYAAGGAVVFVSRVMFPNPRRTAEAQVAPAASAPAEPAAAEEQPAPLPVAA